MEMIQRNHKGFPIKIVDLKGEHTMKLNEDGLKSILLRNSIKNLPLVIVSIVGDFRKGKSFMMNFFLQYLQQSTNNENWMRDVSQDEGFPWRKGIERETTGWLMWSEPFIKRTENGKYVAVILIDSQGAKDHESPIQDCVQLFALSTLVSSIQIINQKNNLQESDFDELNLFLDYGLAVLAEHPKEKPFQNLTFLIRDWDPADDIEFGYDAGKMLLDRKIEMKHMQTSDMMNVRRHIRACFSSLQCFLMHHPGLKMTENIHFTGQLSDMRREFIDDIKIFVPSILEPSKLVVKKINGKEITGKDLFEYIKLYFKQFSDGKMPKVESISTLNSKSSIMFARNEAINFYKSKMNELTSGKKYVSKLEFKHNEFLRDALKLFDSIRKLGCDEYFKECRAQLESDIRAEFYHYKDNNVKDKRCSIKKCFCCFSAD